MCIPLHRFLQEKTVFADSIDRLLDRIVFNANTANESVLKAFNNIMTAIPPLFREEIRKSVFGSDFGDVPFNMLVKNLLPEFNDCEKEEEEKEKPAKKTIPDYFPAIKSDEEEECNATPPTLIYEEPEGEYISLLEVFPEPEEAFPPSSTTTTTNSNNN